MLDYLKLSYKLLILCLFVFSHFSLSFILDSFYQSSKSLIFFFLSAVSNLLLILSNVCFISDIVLLISRSSIWDFLIFQFLSSSQSYFSLSSWAYKTYLLQFLWHACSLIPSNSHFWICFYWFIFLLVTTHIFPLVYILNNLWISDIVNFRVRCLVSLHFF